MSLIVNINAIKMTTFNVFNVLQQLNDLCYNNYDLMNSDLTKNEVNFANNLFEMIDNYMQSINDYEDGQLIDAYTDDEISDNEYQENESDSDFDIENESISVSIYLVDCAGSHCFYCFSQNQI